MVSLGTGQGERESAGDGARGERGPLSFERAAAHVIQVGEHLLAESSAQGGARVGLGVEQIHFRPDGGLEIAPPRRDEPRSDDARELTYALGALLYGWLIGEAPPRRASMSLAHERALRRALAASGLDGETTDLLRRLLAWDPARRPWPELVLEHLRERLPAPSPAAPPEPAASTEAPDEDVPTELAPEPPSAAIDDLATEEQDHATEERAASGLLPDDEDVRREVLSLPVTLDPSEDGLDGEDPFSIPDHAAVIPFPYAIGLGPHTDDEVTDPELHAGVSEDDRTDPELAHAEGEHLSDEPGPELADPEEPTRRYADVATLQPTPPPQDVRLDRAPTAPSPLRQAPAPRPPTRGATPLWVGVAVVILAIAVGAALAT